MEYVQGDALERVAALALNLAALAGAGLLASRAWRGTLTHPKRLAGVVAVALSADVLLWEVLCPSLLARLPGAPYLECALVGPGLLLLLALAAARLRGTAFGRPLLLTSGAGAAFCAFSATAPLLVLALPFGLSTDRAAPPANQSTWWSCGSAATARLAWEMGQQVSEREAALLADTRPWRGTTSIGMAHALDRLGIPARVIQPATWEQLEAAPKPCLADTRILGSVLHVVTVLAIDGQTVRLYDPMTGDAELTPAEFREEWIHTLVVPEAGAAQPTLRHTSAVQASR